MATAKKTTPAKETPNLTELAKETVERVTIVKKGKDFVQIPYSLTQATGRIKELEKVVGKSLLEIASILYTVKKHELYKEKGYKDIVEYAETELGYKKASVYQSLKIAARYVKESTIETNTIEVKPEYKGLTSSQLMELNSLPEEKAREIAPKVKGMTKDETREIVKENKPKKKNTKTSTRKEDTDKVFDLWNKAYETIDCIEDEKKKQIFDTAMKKLHSELRKLKTANKF